MRKESGITLTALILVVIVLMILIGISVSTGIDVVRETKVTQFNNEMKIIQAKVNELAEEKALSELEQLGSEPTEEILEELYWIGTPNGTSGYRHFNNVELKELGIDGITRENIVINFEIRDVIDIRGVPTSEGRIHRGKGYNIEYINPNTNAPAFSVSKKNYGETAKIIVEDIEYKGMQSKGGMSYTYLVNGSETVWTNFVEEIEVTRSGTYKIRVTDSAGNISDEEIEVTIVNSPSISAGMIPVVYDEDINKWKIADSKSGEWYDYSTDEKRWANVMLSDGGAYNENSPAGTVIEENQLREHVCMGAKICVCHSKRIQ